MLRQWSLTISDRLLVMMSDSYVDWSCSVVTVVFAVSLIHSTQPTWRFGQVIGQ
jgi:hypothetical protein